MQLLKIFFLVTCSTILANFSMPKVQVKTQKVQFTKRQQSYVSVGSVIAKNSALLKTKVNGFVVSIDSKSGAKVSKEDIILKLNSRSALAELESAKAMLSKAKWVYDNTKNLYKKQAASELELEAAKQDYLVKKAEVAIKNSSLNDRFIKAPFNGNLGLIKPHVGDYITQGAEIVNIQNNDEVWVDFFLPQRLFSFVHVGDSLTVASSLKSDEKITAKVIAINKKLNNKHQFEVRARFVNKPIWLPIGSYCSVSVPFGEPRDVALIPLIALMSKSSIDKVFVVKNNIVEERNVKVGAILASGLIEITSGLKNNDEVITLGGFKVYNGMEVLVQKAGK